MKAIGMVAAALFGGVVGTARAGQYSDLWWNPQESGWGVNVVQQLETAFVTLFVYAPDGSPTWYVAPAARITHHGTGGPLFTGTLYRTRGPWHGGPFDPAQVQATAARARSCSTTRPPPRRSRAAASSATLAWMNSTRRSARVGSASRISRSNTNAQ